MAISCGGTGGHFYPGLSIAETLQKNGGHVILLLSGAHAEKQKNIAQACGVQAIALPDMPNPHVLKNIPKFISGLIKGFFIARKIVIENNIDIVMGMGSFASLPPIFAAKLLKKQIYLHDGNARIGRANRILSRYAKHLWSAFDAVNADKVKCSCSVSGMPLRPSITERQQFTKEEALLELNSRFGKNFKNSIPTLLIFGGSQGAQKINLVLPEFLKTMPQSSCQIIHLAGPGKLEETSKAYDNCQLEYLLLDASSEMNLMYSAADLVVSRSGGSTVAELAFFGKAALLIPYPFAAENHQYDNAEFLAKHGGAIILDNAACSVDSFNQILTPLITSPEKIAEMSRKSRSAHTHEPITEILTAISQNI